MVTIARRDSDRGASKSWTSVKNSKFLDIGNRKCERGASKFWKSVKNSRFLDIGSRKCERGASKWPRKGVLRKQYWDKLTIFDDI